MYRFERKLFYGILASWFSLAIGGSDAISFLEYDVYSTSDGSCSGDSFGMVRNIIDHPEKTCDTLPAPFSPDQQGTCRLVRNRDASGGEASTRLKWSCVDAASGSQEDIDNVSQLGTKSLTMQTYQGNLAVEIVFGAAPPADAVQAGNDTTGRFAAAQCSGRKPIAAIFQYADDKCRPFNSTHHVKTRCNSWGGDITVQMCSSSSCDNCRVESQQKVSADSSSLCQDDRIFRCLDKTSDAAQLVKHVFHVNLVGIAVWILFWSC